MAPFLRENPALLTDLYELTMAAGYYRHRRHALASFDLFIRDLPKNRSFFLAAGLNDAVEFLNNFRFDSKSIRYLRSLKIFPEDFLRYLSRIRFTGDLWAIPEGTVFFPNEPVLRIVAPLIEAQLLESFLLNIVNLQTTIATKAARIILAARGKNVFDFSLRRTQGSDAALKVARSSYIAGFHGTSNTLAGKLYGIPVAGTMAHSFIMSFDSELAGFRAFAETFPEHSVLLVDTYDTVNGIQNAIVIARELQRKKCRLLGIRLDSGDMARLAKKARALLDRAGLEYVKIFASGNLDEYKIKELLDAQAPIDSFGVGTKMGVSADAPYCDVIYKLTEVTDANGNFLPTMKLSKGKMTYPGRKQIFRFKDKKGTYQKDILGLEHERLTGEALLKEVIRGGKRVCKNPSLKDIRLSVSRNLAALPDLLKKLEQAPAYRVDISPKLKALTAEVSRKIRKKTQS